MFTRVSQTFVAVATKFCTNVPIQSVESRCMAPQLKYSLYALNTRGYCIYNPTDAVSREYDKIDEHKLNELLEQPKYQAMYDKYKLEIEYLKNSTYRIPQTLKASNWLHLFQTKNRAQRRGYMEFLWKIEKKDENKIKRKDLRQKMKEEAGSPEINDSPYGLNRCSIFYRIRDSTMSHFYNSRLISAILHEPKIIFDLAYEKYMSPYEQNNCARQLLLSFSFNRAHDDPFDLHFCNVNKNGLILKNLHKTMPNIYDTDFPLNITTKSYLNLYDREQLVYLTPHTQEVMHEFNPKLVYIIGAMVDKMNPKPISFEKARKQGIRMMRFPLGEKLEWGTGSTKNLPLNQVLSILLDLRHSNNNWQTALEHVPKRKLKTARMHNMERQFIIREKRIAYLTQKK